MVKFSVPEICQNSKQSCPLFWPLIFLKISKPDQCKEEWHPLWDNSEPFKGHVNWIITISEKCCTGLQKCWALKPNCPLAKSEQIVSSTMCPLVCLGNSTVSLIEVSLINQTVCIALLNNKMTGKSRNFDCKTAKYEKMRKHRFWPSKNRVLEGKKTVESPVFRSVGKPGTITTQRPSIFWHAEPRGNYQGINGR